MLLLETVGIRMATERVKSKNLFNFRPQGFLDEDIVAYNEKMKTDFGLDLNAIEEKAKKQSEREYIDDFRAMADVMMSSHSFAANPTYVQGYESCNNTEIKVPTSHHGDYDVTVLVHTPKMLAGQKSRPCIVYAHGGGVVACSAAIYSKYLAHMAVQCEVVVFNVDYRLAPETRCPNNVLDFYSAVKYVASHAEELGVDPDRICMAGESGGGYICSGAMVQLAMRGEAGLVKLAIPIVAMLDDYEFTSRRSMTKQEAEGSYSTQRSWMAIGGPDFESKRAKGDPLLFPGKASDELLAEMPPTIVWESEFDVFVTPACRFAAKLRAAGRLLELVVIPGAKHCSGMMPKFNVFKLEREAWRMAIQEYLIKESPNSQSITGNDKS